MKTKENLRIIFLGTPDFAVEALKQLLESAFNVVAVITNADKPSGRGMQLQASAVKKFAEKNGIPVLQPQRLKDPIFLEELKKINAHVQVVVAFRMLPEVVWQMPPLGTINIHASLLPQYRGAAPINWAIINGEKESGVTTFQLKHEIDTGEMLLQEKINILPTDNAGTLHDKLAQLGGDLIVKTLEELIKGTLHKQEQKFSAEDKKAPKIFKPDTQIQWNQAAERIHNFIRGLSPHPAAMAQLGSVKIKLFTAEIELSHVKKTPGEIQTDQKTYIKVACQDGFISIKELQAEGKKRMSVEDYLRGNKI